MAVASKGLAADAVALILNGKGEEDAYGIIIKSGDEEGDADLFSGHGVIITSGVDVGVSNAVGVEDG